MPEDIELEARLEQLMRKVNELTIQQRQRMETAAELFTELVRLLDEGETEALRDLLIELRYFYSQQITE